MLPDMDISRRREAKFLRITAQKPWRTSPRVYIHGQQHSQHRFKLLSRLNITSRKPAAVDRATLDLDKFLSLELPSKTHEQHPQYRHDSPLRKYHKTT